MNLVSEVFGAGADEYPVCAGSCWNIGHQSTSGDSPAKRFAVMLFGAIPIVNKVNKEREINTSKTVSRFT